MQTFLRRDEDGFREFIKKHKAQIFKTIYSFCGNTSDAEDIAQEVFISVWKNIKKFKGKSSISTWLYRITINKCIDWMRKKKMHVELNENLDLMQEKSNETRYIVEKILSKLPEKYKTVVILREMDGFSYEEISKILKTSKDNVKVLLFRARERMREIANEMRIFK